MLKELVKERLMAAADEIFALFEKTVASYEKELSRTREKERQLEAVSETQTVLGIKADFQQPIRHQEIRPPQPRPPHIKEEKQVLWITQEGECFLGPNEADLTKLPLTGVSVKNEDQGEPPESSELHHSLREENRWAESPSSDNPRHMTSEAPRGSQADNLLAPLSDSDNTMSHYLEDEDWDKTQELLSGDSTCKADIRTPINKKHPECSKDKIRFTCSVCSETFSQKRDLNRHVKKHTTENPFSCSFCGHTFPFRSTFKRHMRTHTGEKPFSCSVCGKGFPQKSNFLTHMRQHTGEKPFSCSVCGKRFSQKSNFITHTRQHTGEKPFSCSVCGKRFSQKSPMVLHMKTHSGKLYPCSFCGKRYYYKTSLKVHMRMHNGE
ncbi:oocyte zinc finger protein XlCOF7.1-like isoform X1 [Nerophis ophidion]|uniref:oocyte zinc finger protein XlCOF7.1-like isoform X1 n=1 Tax=Nerophis ophidion TaxID=159077 RepID=UPI002ADF2F3E|nr:oocyte zinc finger protein XlCOF7.1-like isoform X1 [Nerophis ophidion]